MRQGFNSIQLVSGEAKRKQTAMLMLMLMLKLVAMLVLVVKQQNEREGQWAVGDIAAGATCQVKCVDAVLLRYNDGDALDLDIHWASAWVPGLAS